VKGRVAGVDAFTITKNEVLYALNKGFDYVLALVRVDGDRADEVRYIRQPFTGSDEVLFGVTSLNVGWDEMFERGTTPA
jgi:Protein NO VEIN, C-terminal